jgi:hypothetical protein
MFTCQFFHYKHFHSGSASRLILPAGAELHVDTRTSTDIRLTGGGTTTPALVPGGTSAQSVRVIQRDAE